ncbi:Hypothetical protein CAP_6847 [Chondromyces apiculatus DSM 436]|uniref:Uncharacterized protein n=2 Tax=Chondromyces apiculatus TaxID=51 RepID=A0A017TG70_9BACT|nr:Hypothetical protein CAP_6847 [Chondromyces apiculatus DSM 436]
MVSTVVGNVVVVLHGEAPPREEEWARYIGLIRERDLLKTASIVFTDGGAPSSKQRAEINEILAGRHPRGAVVSHNPLLRGVITALALVNPQTRSFSPDKLADAFTFLKLTRDEIAAVQQTLEALCAEIGFRPKSLPRLAPSTT